MTPLLRAAVAERDREHLARLADPRALPKEKAASRKRLTSSEHDEIRRLREAGVSLHRIAEAIGCDPSSVQHSLSKSRGSHV